MKQLISLLLTLVGLITIFSCNDVETINVESKVVKDIYSKRDSLKWAEEDAKRAQNIKDSIAQAEENARIYALYIEDLKAYKKSKHHIMFGWFNSWNPLAPGEYSQLNLIPDSLDIISIWGGGFNLNEEKKSQLAEVQSKGTKVVLGWIIENIGDQIVWDKSFWPNEKEEAVKAYAQAIVDTINKYNYDGFDIDYEPSYASPFKPGNHCGDWKSNEGWSVSKPLISCDKNSNKELENLFFKTMRELLGPDKILNINGSIDWLDPEAAQYFNYFVVQSYNGSYSGWTGSVMNRLSSAGVKKDRIIYTETFQNNTSNRKYFMRYADYVVTGLNGEAAGIGAFHINEDAFDNSNYKYVREAISKMNPPIK